MTSFVEMLPVDSVLDKRTNPSQPSRMKNGKFAAIFPVDLDPEDAGVWEKTGQGMVWRLGIRSHNAYSLYLTFHSFFLRKGVRLFVYSPDYTSFRGAFTQQNNNAFQILSTATITGESLIIELNVPLEAIDYGKLHLSKVYHDYANAFGKNNANARIQTPCNENINCSNGKYWQTEKRAVCMILTDGELSSGALIGNTSGDQRPYVLTAHHTMFDSIHAAESIFYFNYEYFPCENGLTTDDHTLSGASLIATTDNKLDFTLVKLHDIPPVSYQPYYAGWDLSSAPPAMGVCIHHPGGMEKQIAIDYHPLNTGSLGLDFNALSFWKIARWDIGTTEGGSSGSPLFNSQHRVVGSLSGGEATCYDPVNDYFSKFNLAWSTYPDAANQLKVWLDPENKNISYLDGYDPYGFNIGSCDTTSNIQDDQKVELSSTGLVWGWRSGHNSSTTTQYAEKFISPASLELPGVFMHVAKAYDATPLSNIVVKVWEDDALPSEEIYSKVFFIKDLLPGINNHLAFDSIVKVRGNFFIGYEINYTTPVDSFAVYQTINGNVTEPSTMYVYDGRWKNITATSGFAASLDIGIVECYGKIRNPGVTTLKIYPNPCHNFINIDVPPEMTIENVECFDISGRKVPVTFAPSEEINQVYFNLPAGLYILKVSTDKKQFLSKFMVSKE